MYTEEEQNLICLAYSDELTYNARYTLLSGCEKSTPDFAKYESTLIKTCSRGVYNKVWERFYDCKFRRRVFENLENAGVKCVTYFSEGYPQNLKHISAPPLVLFCKGDTSLLKTRCFSVVGSRKSLPKTLAECKKIAGEISSKFTVVSGVADGADAAALEGALQRGKAISVLAYGFGCVYPPTCGPLLNRLEREGLLVTEYIPGTQPRTYTFPIRNRIIAGLSEATLVVSAGLKSGALNTACRAMEYGRDLFAFPYTAGTPSGAGCNSLIKKGAYLTENILDISAVFGLDFNTPEPKPLTLEERELYDIIKEEGEAFLPAVAEKLGKQIFQIIPLMSALEVKGLVARLGGNRYQAIE